MKKNVQEGKKRTNVVLAAALFLITGVIWYILGEYNIAETLPIRALKFAPLLLAMGILTRTFMRPAIDENNSKWNDGNEAQNPPQE